MITLYRKQSYLILCYKKHLPYFVHYNHLILIHCKINLYFSVQDSLDTLIPMTLSILRYSISKQVVEDVYLIILISDKNENNYLHRQLFSKTMKLNLSFIYLSQTSICSVKNILNSSVILTFKLFS